MTRDNNLCNVKFLNLCLIVLLLLLLSLTVAFYLISSGSIKAFIHQATLLLATVVTRLYQPCSRVVAPLLQLLQATKLPGVWRPLSRQTRQLPKGQ